MLRGFFLSDLEKDRNRLYKEKVLAGSPKHLFEICAVLKRKTACVLAQAVCFYTLSGSKMKSGRGSQDAAWGLILARSAE